MRLSFLDESKTGACLEESNKDSSNYKPGRQITRSSLTGDRCYPSTDTLKKNTDRLVQSKTSTSPMVLALRLETERDSPSPVGYELWYPKQLFIKEAEVVGLEGTWLQLFMALKTEPVMRRRS